jgi:hypothetical protein
VTWDLIFLFRASLGAIKLKGMGELNFPSYSKLNNKENLVLLSSLVFSLSN